MTEDPILCAICGQPSAIFHQIGNVRHRLAKTMIRISAKSSNTGYVHESPCYGELIKKLRNNETKQDNS
jgi:hypothetical protein